MSFPASLPVHLPRLTSLGAAAAFALPLLPPALKVLKYALASKAKPPTLQPKAPLSEGTRWFEPGQTGVTYEEILGRHLESESSITIVDPHIKTFRQIRNLRELLLGAVADTSEGQIYVRLVTASATGGFDWEYGQASALVKLQEEVAEHGITLSVEFDDSNHDRWITTSKWKILLGKGLDLWDAQHAYGVPQELRPVGKRFTVTYCRITEK